MKLYQRKEVSFHFSICTSWNMFLWCCIICVHYSQYCPFHIFIVWCGSTIILWQFELKWHGDILKSCVSCDIFPHIDASFSSIITLTGHGNLQFFKFIKEKENLTYCLLMTSNIIFGVKLIHCTYYYVVAGIPIHVLVFNLLLLCHFAIRTWHTYNTQVYLSSHAHNLLALSHLEG